MDRGFAEQFYNISFPRMEAQFAAQMCGMARLCRPSTSSTVWLHNCVLPTVGPQARSPAAEFGNGLSVKPPRAGPNQAVQLEVERLRL